MRSFVILSLLASTFAAPVIDSSLNGGSPLAPVEQLTGSVQQMVAPALPVVDGAVAAADTVGGLAGTPQPGQLLGDVGTVQNVAGAVVKRSPLLEGVNSVPGIAEALGGAAVADGAVTGTPSSLLGTAEGLGRRFSGSLRSGIPIVGGLLDGLIGGGEGGGLLKRVTRRALTSLLSNVPAVSSLASTAGGALQPATGSIPEVEGLLQGVPGGDAVTGVLNTGLGALENV